MWSAGRQTILMSENNCTNITLAYGGKMVACHDLMILCNWVALKSCPLTSCLDPDWPLSLCCLRSLVKHTHTYTHTGRLTKDHLSMRFIYLIISQSENRLCRIFEDVKEPHTHASAHLHTLKHTINYTPSLTLFSSTLYFYLPHT